MKKWAGRGQWESGFRDLDFGCFPLPFGPSPSPATTPISSSVALLCEQNNRRRNIRITMLPGNPKVSTWSNQAPRIIRNHANGVN